MNEQHFEALHEAHSHSSPRMDFFCGCCSDT